MEMNKTGGVGVEQALSNFSKPVELDQTVSVG